MEEWTSILGVSSSDPRTTSLTHSFFPALYVGESPYGLYAIDVLVDHHTITYSPKLLGPPLLEGSAPIALSKEEIEHYLPPKRPIVTDILSITHKTIEGEFLLAGPEPKNKLLSKNIRHDDLSFFSIAEAIYEKYPKQLLIATFTILVLFFSVVWMCGKQWGHSSAISSAMAVNGEAQTSRQSNSSLTDFRIRDYSNVPEGWMSTGKIQYNPKDILGRGCQGTVVYKGKFDGRDVAVKRVVSEFVKFAHREADLLRESDAHQHVIRYFCMEADSQFRYLALELCIASLNDYVDNDEVRRAVKISSIEILRQAADGLAHLHASKIVHRDIKPQNVLITSANQSGVMRTVISDFGLCKKVQPGKNSISIGLTSGLVGTDGWIAPEAINSNSTSYPVDIFSLGCIFYYVLSNGEHPFGTPIERQSNIINKQVYLDKLQLLDDYHLAEKLISSMIAHEPSERPLSSHVLIHPFFWSAERRLAFFSDVSDRVEKESDDCPVVRRLECEAVFVCGSWRDKICDALREDLRKFRTYKSFSVRDLLRAMRNKKHHYQELPKEVQNSLGELPDQFLYYFTSRFPKLLLHVYTAFEYCSAESVFRNYYSDEVRQRMEAIVAKEEEYHKEMQSKVEDEEWQRAKTKTARSPHKLDSTKKNKKKKSMP
ncbi:unnamed protein product [Caenorhabditis bovis]|uniref:non-specific serine/threonine protein kinase n=1 Tax=Caenorhabditis bovis TaxID=2654633 RepID=A0A8S1EY98_9PELO|nr:unnamed protein product [Caenorhabditis bovis]